MKEKALVLLIEHKFRELGELLASLDAPDAAALLAEFPEEVLPLIFRLLPKGLAADTFVEMDADMQKRLIGAFSDLELKEVFDRLFVDDTVDIIEEMPANVVNRIIANCSNEKRRAINEVLSYPDDSAGSIMTIEYVGLKAQMTVSDAFMAVRKTGVAKETIYTCYVVDDDRHLIGLVTAKDLMLSEPDVKVGELMETRVISASTHTDKKEVAEMIRKYDFLALPVVDSENRLVGIVTVDDAIDVITEAAEDDFAKMAAIEPMENSYFKTGIFTHSRKRMVWLLVLMLSAAVTGAIITAYEEAFAALPLLIASLPMLMGTGGNCGSQASTMMIRGLAVGEVEPKDIGRVLWKELRIGAVIGLALAVVNTLRIFITYHGRPDCLMLALVTGITLIAVVLIAKSLGCALPLAAKKLHLDPALMASPLLATVCDTCVVLIYFNIATLFMNIMG